MVLARHIRLLSTARRYAPWAVGLAILVGVVDVVSRGWPRVLPLLENISARWASLNTDRRIAVGSIVIVIVCAVPVVLYRYLDQREKRRRHKNEFLLFFQQVPLGGVKIGTDDRQRLEQDFFTGEAQTTNVSNLCPWTWTLNAAGCLGSCVML